MTGTILFVIFNLLIFYTLYWAYKEDEKDVEKNRDDRQPFSRKKN